MARDFNRSRVRTYPTCRNNTTTKTMHRVYFDVVSDKPGEDTSALRNEINNLDKQLDVKESIIKNVTEENKNLKSQIEGLSELNKKLESKISARDNEIAAATVAARRNLDKLKRELQETSDQDQDLKEQLRISAEFRDRTHLNCVRCGVVEIKYAERHCVSRGRKLVATRCSRSAAKDQPNEGQQPADRGAERWQQPTARGSSRPPGAAERGQQPAARGSSHPPGAAERVQQPAARGSNKPKWAAASRQG